jgi:hypothetical protein
MCDVKHEHRVYDWIIDKSSIGRSFTKTLFRFRQKEKD